MKLIVNIIFFSSFIYAHKVGGSGFLAGFEHPVLGFDHFLAMVSVGIWSAQIGGRAIWFVPATFVGFMVLGGTIGMSGVEIPLIEVGIAISVFLLGIAVASKDFIDIKIGLAFVAFFGVFHGYAHGVEMPMVKNATLYAFGFVLGTTLIHILGVFIGLFSQKREKSAQFLRYIGAGIAGIGFHIFITFVPLISIMIKMKV